jgi:hypothetical protein
MSVNKSRPHVLLLPEDDANRQMAAGFRLGQPVLNRQIMVLEVAGGWKKVLYRFKSDHAGAMVKYPDRFMILLIDFDGREDRLNQAKTEIPTHLLDRVFILGAWTEPEALRRAIGGNYETIGKAMEKDCREESGATWGHELLRHNASEIERLRQHVRPILFQAT